jgi:hypothetical protein
MSLEMAHKVIVPQKKIMSRSFLNSGTLIVKMNCHLIFVQFIKLLDCPASGQSGAGMNKNADA